MLSEKQLVYCHRLRPRGVLLWLLRRSNLRRSRPQLCSHKILYVHTVSLPRVLFAGNSLGEEECPGVGCGRPASQRWPSSPPNPTVPNPTVPYQWYQ